MQIALFSSLLLQLTLLTGIDASSPQVGLDMMEAASQMETKQCLMQKKHELARTSQSASSDHHGDKDHNVVLPSVRGLSSPPKSHPTRSKISIDGDDQKDVRESSWDKSWKKAVKQDVRKRHQELASASFVQMGQKDSNKMQTIPDLHAALPEPILAVARTLFKDDEAIAKIVENSVLVNVKYAGVQMSLRMNKADDATRRLGEEGQWFSYDLDTLGELRTNPDDALNMLDVGGNLGVVTIAAFKKHSKNLRLITLEPIPMTYFFLRWNLYINGVPEIAKAALDEKSKSPGVLALNRGSADVEGQDLHFCFDPKSSMNSRICDCKSGEENCIIVPSVTVESLASMFGDEPIAMVKMDCEGCEFKSLPALATPQIAKRVLRLAGELHLPDRNLEDIACRWDHGRLLTKCQHSKKEHPIYEIECDVALDCSV